MKSFFSKLICCLLLLSVLFLTAGDIAAGTEYSADYNAVLGALSSGEPQFGSIGGEWKVLALARSGYFSADSEYMRSYISLIEELILSIGSPKLDERKPNENSRLVIALSSLGYDARNVSGFDLTEPLKDINYIKKQGLTGVIYALIALSCNDEYAETDYKNTLVDFVLNAEIDGGGWALGGGNPDPDVTAIAITAVTGYTQARSAIERGIAKLSDMQAEDATYSSYGATNSESCSQVLLALSTLGIDAGTDQRFIKNGVPLLSALLSVSTGSGFSHMPNGSTNQMASEQAAYALCAYDRMVKSRTALFDMSDVWHAPVQPTPSAASTPKPTPKPTSTAAPFHSEAPPVSAVTTVQPTQEDTDAPALIEVPSDVSTEAADTTPDYEAPTEQVTIFEMGSDAPTVQTTQDDSRAPSEKQRNGLIKLLWVLPAAVLAAALIVIKLIRGKKKV